MNLSDIIAINICKQGSDNMRIAICDDEVSMVQILEEKIKKLLPDAVIDKYLSGDELIASGSKPDILFLDIQMPGNGWMEIKMASTNATHLIQTDICTRIQQPRTAIQ